MTLMRGRTPGCYGGHAGDGAPPGARGSPAMPAPEHAFDLTGRVAVVTGATSGLGEGIARALAACGACIAAVGRRHDLLDALVADIGGLGVPCDLQDEEQLCDVVPRAVRGLGPPEVLVNAAGNIFTHARAEDEPLDAVMQTLRLNLVAPFRLCQDVFPHMVAPGFFRSPITDELYDDERGGAWLRRNTPLPMEATVDDIAGAVVWLVSDAGRYVTGQTIAVDGGWTAR